MVEVVSVYFSANCKLNGFFKGVLKKISWNNLNFNTCAFEVVEEQDVLKKIEALSKYQSQAHRPYANEEFLRSQLRMRGVQVTQRYAEVFEAVRLVMP